MVVGGWVVVVVGGWVVVVVGGWVVVVVGGWVVVVVLPAVSTNTWVVHTVSSMYTPIPARLNFGFKRLARCPEEFQNAWNRGSQLSVPPPTPTFSPHERHPAGR